jgi:hypothetical protein
MAKLIDSRVRRAGVTASHWKAATTDIAAYSRSAKKLALKFEIGSSGGTTEVEVLIGTKDFKRILEIMIEVDRMNLLKIMSRELAKQIISLEI